MRKIELLAPGGDLDSIKAAIIAGADAVYLGLIKFNARNRAANISFDKLQGILRLAHNNDCEIFLTLNILILESEIPELIGLLNKLVNTSIDGVIVQDLGLFYLISKYFKGLSLHASTQLTTHNEGQIKFLSKLSVSRANLSRELNINEIKSLTTLAKSINISTEVFVHGSYCISFSGICYMSSVVAGKSGNRGSCSQQCRDRFETTRAGINYPLNLKDNSAYYDLEELANAGVSSLKIEGRIKEFEYVFTVVDSWRKQLQRFYNRERLSEDNSALHSVFNRDFSNGYLKGEISQDMFIDDPGSQSTDFLSKTENGRLDSYARKAELREDIESRIGRLSIDKAPLSITVSGQNGTPLVISLITPDESFKVHSDINLVDKGTEVLTQKIIMKRLKALGDNEYYIKDLDFKNLQEDLYLPFREIGSIRNRLLFQLNGSKEYVAPVRLPDLQKTSNEKAGPNLSVLISNPKDFELGSSSSANIYFQLPAGLRAELDFLIDLFRENEELIPWFPSILIGDDYLAGLDLLGIIKPKLIVTNNSGIAYEASEMGLNWISGPYMNITNSYSLLCLKEMRGCTGAFISNELNQQQIKTIKKPEGFELHFSIYHPIVLMTSRQCLSHQVDGCKKSIIDGKCISACVNNSSIRNMQGENFFIDKNRGNYHTVYNEYNYLNTKVMNDFPFMFSGYFIDLRNTKTSTEVSIDKIRIIELFERLIQGSPKSAEELAASISGTTCQQYVKGIK